jgi:hypothetical protein
VEENLRQEGLTCQASGDDEEDEDENFSKRERTIKADNLDLFSRLMKQKIEVSLSLILNFFNQLLQQY